MFDVEKTKGRKPITTIKTFKDRPAYSMATIKKIRDELQDIIGFRYLEHEFTQKMLLNYLEDFCFYMNWSENHIENLYQSIYPYTKRHPIFTKEVCDIIAYRIAGGYLNLHSGEVLPLVGAKVLDRWLGVEVISSQLSRKHFNRQLIMLKFNVTAGSIAGSLYSQEFPISAISRVFKESLKFNKYKSVDTVELFGMQFMAYLTMTEQGSLQFTKIVTNSHQDKFNRELRSRRSEDCIHNTTFECNDCPVGSDRCDRATHLLTREIQECKNTMIDPHKGYVDPEQKNGFCSYCVKLQATGNNFYKPKQQSLKDET